LRVDHRRLAKSGAEIDSNGAETDRHSDRNGLRQPRRDLSLAGGLVVAANCFSTQHDFGCPQPPGHSDSGGPRLYATR
jgi:hypothetical protein